jgi:cytochrome P450
MHTVASLDLPYLPVETAEFAENPHRFFREARKKHPWLAQSSIGLLIHEYTAIRELLGQDEKFLPAYEGLVEVLGAHGTPWGRFTEQQLISLPTDQHRLLRNTFAAKFTPRFANQLRPMMRARIRLLLDDWAPRGKIDFEEFAAYFPISNMFTLVGAPVNEIPVNRHQGTTRSRAFGCRLSDWRGRRPFLSQIKAGDEKPDVQFAVAQSLIVIGAAHGRICRTPRREQLTVHRLRSPVNRRLVAPGSVQQAHPGPRPI